LGALAYRRNPAEAIQYFEHAASLGIDFFDNYKYLGNLYLKLGRYKDAIRILKIANDMKTDPVTLNDLSCAYSSLHVNQIEAVVLAERAYQLDKNPIVKRTLTKAYVNLKSKYWKEMNISGLATVYVRMYTLGLSCGTL
jgi:tetratricopeptide (TPR) repeat protein